MEPTLWPESCPASALADLRLNFGQFLLPCAIGPVVERDFLTADWILQDIGQFVLEPSKGALTSGLPHHGAGYTGNTGLSHHGTGNTGLPHHGAGNTGLPHHGAGKTGNHGIHHQVQGRG